ncbi:hypothetical protein VRZ08_08865 [Rhodopseudomonas sp. G2_2311]|uniref:hypothetical protein n=1 Tax=Rhodopseudomonas sp. G2_2311 TaxID=3114287 RepID=UPI0039C69818
MDDPDFRGGQSRPSKNAADRTEPCRNTMAPATEFTVSRLSSGNKKAAAKRGFFVSFAVCAGQRHSTLAIS